MANSSVMIAAFVGGAIAGAAAVIYARPRIPAALWWLFGAGE